ncbi:ketopantoate reductase family protein [Piscinibacter sp.]|uniref:ketopantoate reductase family protein n=1 Tax=Piscinibacter sp. TaxID=1903157 RepID=UPI002C8F8480|nr:2-dehydropantoate 2-reductase [Albitalea sp.]HUG26064.1 2-dehydropantoate 2-reductase [Albitalea sp.]
MRITILGAGAMGSLFGGLLAEQGHEVELLDVNAVHITRVQQEGLMLDTDAKGRRVVRVPITRPEAAEGRPECLVVFTKTLHTSNALAAALGALRPDTLVLTLQNGLGNVETLARFVAPSRIAVGVTTVPADLVAPGHVHSHGEGHVRMMMSDGSHCDRLLALAQALTNAGLSTTVDPSVQAAIWEKVAFNAALNTVCAVANCTVGDVGSAPPARALAHRIASEVLAVAAADGVRVDEPGLHGMLDHALEHHLAHKPSMLQDLLAGRQTEIDAINGEVLRAASRLGIPTPCTEALDALVRLRQGLVPSAGSSCY